MKILVTGSTGLVGTALVKKLKQQGHDVVRLMRRWQDLEEPQVFWDPAGGKLDPVDLQGIDAVVHLAGESVFGRWTPEKMDRIYKSRFQGTRLLAETLAQMTVPPKILITASAVGYYGDRGKETLTEVSGPGEGFLAETCRDWEAAARPAMEKGLRVVYSRFGLVLSAKGGAYRVMYWPFKLGLAGPLGSGRQYLSWISMYDTIQALVHLLNTESVYGPVNMVGPSPVTNAEFTRVMRSVVTPVWNPLKYLPVPPAPAFAVKAIAGQMGEELLLASAKVLPVRLQETGYVFRDASLKQALQNL